MVSKFSLTSFTCKRILDLELMPRNRSGLQVHERNVILLSLKLKSFVFGGWIESTRFGGIRFHGHLRSHDTIPMKVTSRITFRWDVFKWPNLFSQINSRLSLFLPLLFMSRSLPPSGTSGPSSVSKCVVQLVCWWHQRVRFLSTLFTSQGSTGPV